MSTKIQKPSRMNSFLDNTFAV